MPYVRTKLAGYFTLSDAARETHFSITRFWELVYLEQRLPPPHIVSGRRMYYDADSLALVKRLAGRLKQ